VTVVFTYLLTYLLTEMIEMRPWTKPSRRSSGNMRASAAGHSRAAVVENWPPSVGLSAVVNDARLRDALQCMYIPPSLLRIGSTIGRGLYVTYHLFIKTIKGSKSLLQVAKT